MIVPLASVKLKAGEKAVAGVEKEEPLFVERDLKILSSSRSLTVEVPDVLPSSA